MPRPPLRFLSLACDAGGHRPRPAFVHLRPAG